MEESLRKIDMACTAEVGSSQAQSRGCSVDYVYGIAARAGPLSIHDRPPCIVPSVLSTARYPFGLEGASMGPYGPVWHNTEGVTQRPAGAVDACEPLPAARALALALACTSRSLASLTAWEDGGALTQRRGPPVTSPLLSPVCRWYAVLVRDRQEPPSEYRGIVSVPLKTRAAKRPASSSLAGWLPACRRHAYLVFACRPFLSCGDAGAARPVLAAGP